MSLADKLTAVAENVPKVYEAGKQSEYDRFWDAFQNNGDRISYNRAFSGAGWTKENFKPKYKITLSSGYNAASYVFEYFGWGITNRSDENNLPSLTADMIDFADATTAVNTFNNASFALLEVDFKTVTQFTRTFSNDDGGVTHHIVCKMNPSSLNNAFHYLVHLKTLEFMEGSVIGCNGFNIQYSTRLDVDSLIGVLNVLEDKSADTSGTSWVATLGATNLAKLTDAQKAIATQKGWTLA